MEKTDRLLVRRFVGQGDTEAFSTIMSQYAGMVHGTCRRVLGNDAQAADVTQETFFDFLRSADRITGSLGSWLHQVATRRAIDLVRQNVSRRRREEAYAAGVLNQADSWEVVEPLVDEALEELPEDLREVLILHYLKGRSMTEIAAGQRVSQSTISRRAATALEQLRERLRAKDVVVGATALGAMLSESVQAAPVPVIDSLGKIALAQAASAGAELAAASSGPLTGAGMKATLAIAAIVLITGTTWIVIDDLGAANRSGSSQAENSQPPAPDEASLPQLAEESAAPTGATLTGSDVEKSFTAPSLPSDPAGEAVPGFEMAGSTGTGVREISLQGPPPSSNTKGRLIGQRRGGAGWSGGVSASPGFARGGFVSGSGSGRPALGVGQVGRGASIGGGLSGGSFGGSGFSGGGARMGGSFPGAGFSSGFRGGAGGGGSAGGGRGGAAGGFTGGGFGFGSGGPGANFSYQTNYTYRRTWNLNNGISQEPQTSFSSGSTRQVQPTSGR